MFQTTLRKLFEPRAKVVGRKPVLRLETLEDREVPATFNVGPHQTYATIQAAINAAEAAGGSDSVVIHSGTYKEALVIPTDSALTALTIQPASGSSVTIKAPATVPDAFGITSLGGAVIDVYATKVTINGINSGGSSLTIDDTGSNVNAGIRIIDGGSATVENLSVGHTNKPKNAISGNGIQVGSIFAKNMGVDMGVGTATVSNNTVSDFIGAGVLVANTGSSATISDNTITGLGSKITVVQYGIQVGNDASATVSNNTVSNFTFAVDNTFYSAGIFVFSPSTSSSAPTKIADNTVSNNLVGVLVQSATPSAANIVTVADNTVSGSTGYAGIDILNSTFLQVANNTVSNNSSLNGIALSSSTNTTVSDNTITGNSNADGIFVFEGSSNSLSDNTSSSNGFDGIYLFNSSTNTLTDNTTSNNGSTTASSNHFSNGIRVEGGSNNTISGGTSDNNLQEGIYVLQASGTTISGVTSSKNSGFGILLDGSTGTTISSATLSGNTKGGQGSVNGGK
jgi:parallel beta-helix repeat protein